MIASFVPEAWSIMLLNSDSVVHYLLQRGFLSFDSVVDGDLVVLEAPRREPYGLVVVFADPWGGKWDLLQPTSEGSRTP